MKPFSRTLEFAGKNISVLHADGKWWVAIKPICDALDIDYIRAFKNLKEDDFFTDALSKQTMRDTKNRLQEMVCINEKDVYGWLCSIRSESPEFKAYRRKCYDILYAHFHGTLTGRMEVLQERLDVDQKIIDLQTKMLQSDEQRQIMELRKSKNMLAKRLRELDKELVEGQISINFS